MGINKVKISPRTPWQNPYGEWVIGNIRRERLDHVIVLNKQYLRRVLRFYVDDSHLAAHRCLEMDSSDHRPVRLPALGSVLKLPEVGGSHCH